MTEALGWVLTALGAIVFCYIVARVVTRAILRTLEEHRSQ